MTSSLVNQHRKRVVAVISAFRPGPSLLGHCATLSPQVAAIVVVDDGSGPAAEPVLRELEQSGVTVVRQTENTGIAAAMNRGLQAVATLDLASPPEFVVTFDQDSEVPAGFIDALIDESDRCTAAGHTVGMVAPEFFSATPQTRMQQPGGGVLEAYAPIQSGLLMPLDTVAQLGPQREDYFIDLVDTEYFLRARRHGLLAVCVPGLTLPHGFGRRLYVHAFGRRLTKRSGRPRMVAVSTPFRYYYRARNRVALAREYGRLDPEIRRLLKRDARNDLLLDFAVAVYSARGKVALARVMWAGWRDGRRGRLGKIPPKTEALAQRVTWRHPVPDEPAAPPAEPLG